MPRDCAMFGTSHCPAADNDDRAVAIASEPVTDEEWIEILGCHRPCQSQNGAIDIVASIVIFIVPGVISGGQMGPMMPSASKDPS